MLFSANLESVNTIGYYKHLGVKDWLEPSVDYELDFQASSEDEEGINSCLEAMSELFGKVHEDLEIDLKVIESVYRSTDSDVTLDYI